MRRWMRGMAAGAVGLVLAATGASAAPPACDGLYPAGGQRGSSVAVQALGKFDAWPVQVWTDTPGLRVEVGKKSGELTVHVAKDAPLGPRMVRLYTADGASGVRCFVVGEQREAAEVEPNDETSKATPAGELPVTINGQLEKSGDVDHFAVSLAAGQCLVASAQGRRLGSGLDPMLHVIDPAGVAVAYAQDGLGLDPLLVYRAPVAGTYVLRVSAFAYPPVADVRLAGGKDAAYRLNVTTGPYVRRAVPAGVRRGEKGTVRLVGWNLVSDHVEVDATAVGAGVRQIFVPVPGGDVPLAVDVTDVPEAVKAELMSFPANVSGAIGSAGEADRYTFAAKKGERFEFVVRGGTIGSALDAVLRLEDAAGKELATNDDAGGGNDAKVDWTAPADGTYRAVVSDLYGRGGGEYVYRLEVGRPGPEVTATLDGEAYALLPGKTTAVKVTVARKNGHAGQLIAVATGLPAGVAATSAEVPAKGGEVTLTLSAAADAKPASGPIRVMLLGTDAAKPEVVGAFYELRKDHDKAGIPVFFERVGEPWLTVSPTASVGPAKAG